MPVSTLDGLIEAYAQLSTLNQRAMGHFEVVAEAFERRGIDCIVLKGADLISRLYGIKGIRPMIDIDLLVHEADLPTIDEILRSLGYEQAIDGNPAYCAPGRGVTFDLVTSIWYLDSPEALDGVWQRAVTRKIGSRVIKSMSSEDLFIYLTAYAVLHRATLSPQFARDVSLLVQKEPLDWGFIVEEVSRRNLAVAVHHGLSYVSSREELNGVPEEVLKQISPRGLRDQTLSFLVRRLVTEQYLYGVGLLMLFITRPGMKKWQWLSRSLFPHKNFLTCRYGSHAAARPVLTRLARLFSLVLQGGRLVLKMFPRMMKRPTVAPL